MPAKSESQRKMMCAAASGKSTKAKGISKKAAGEYCHTPGKLPKKIKK